MKAVASPLPVRDGNNLFELDTILPDQYYATFKRGNYGDPEKRLMEAILEDAVSCLSKNPRTSTRQQRRAHEDAVHWINVQGEDDWIFSFASVCESLGFDPNFMRRGLTRWEITARAGSPQPLRMKKYRSGARHRKLRFRSVM